MQTATNVKEFANEDAELTKELNFSRAATNQIWVRIIYLTHHLLQKVYIKLNQFADHEYPPDNTQNNHKKGITEYLPAQEQIWICSDESDF